MTLHWAGERAGEEQAGIGKTAGQRVMGTEGTRRGRRVGKKVAVAAGGPEGMRGREGGRGGRLASDPSLPGSMTWRRLVRPGPAPLSCPLCGIRGYPS